MVGAGANIFDKLKSESEPKFLTRWSRSRTEMDRLRNTDFGTKKYFFLPSFQKYKLTFGTKCSTTWLLQSNEIFLNLAIFEATGPWSLEEVFLYIEWFIAEMAFLVTKEQKLQ
jgi:hypothetical protein